jgi:hypothetical protein
LRNISYRANLKLSQVLAIGKSYEAIEIPHQENPWSSECRATTSV